MFNMDGAYCTKFCSLSILYNAFVKVLSHKPWQIDTQFPTPYSRVFLEMIAIVPELVKKFPHFTEPNRLFPFIQEPAKCAYCKSDESIPRRTIMFFFKVHFYIILLFTNTILMQQQYKYPLYMKQCVLHSFERTHSGHAAFQRFVQLFVNSVQTKWRQSYHTKAPILQTLRISVWKSIIQRSHSNAF